MDAGSIGKSTSSATPYLSPSHALLVLKEMVPLLISTLGSGGAETDKLPLRRISVFLAIAQKSGISNREIAEDLGMADAVVSRHVMSLIEIGLVDFTPQGRMKCNTLTTKGKTASLQIGEALSSLTKAFTL